MKLKCNPRIYSEVIYVKRALRFTCRFLNTYFIKLCEISFRVISKLNYICPRSRFQETFEDLTVVTINFRIASEKITYECKALLTAVHYNWNYICTVQITFVITDMQNREALSCWESRQ